MDIKSKDIRYATGTKIVAVVLVWLCFISAVGGWAFVEMNQSIMNSSRYYDSYDFREEFSRLLHNTVEANVKLKSVDSIKASGKSEDEKSANIDRFYKIKERLADTINFMYYIRNTLTGEAITNITAAQPLDLIKKQRVKVYASQLRWEADYNFSWYRSEIEKMLEGGDYEVYAALQEPLKPGDIFYEDFMEYSRIKAIAPYVYPALVASLILLVCAAAYLAIVAGRKEKDGEIEFLPIDRLHTDVHLLLVLAAAVISVLIAGNTFNPNNMASWIVLFAILSIDAFIGIVYVLSMIRQAKAGRIFRNTLSYTLVRILFTQNTFKPSVLLFLLGYGLVNGILFDLGVDLNNGAQEPIFTALLIIFNAVALYFVVKALLSVTQIMKAVKEISDGNLDYPVNSSEISIAFSDMAENIENIQDGLKRAVAEAVKGERMKTDLITNVSHDLKTPLTSIVNYVDLLKKEELNNEKAEEYVSILEEKSARLKQLVEDLVEASKASSGNLTVNAEKVDLHELVLQACGEYEEKIKESELDIRINAEEKNTYVNADGKQMWRIIENLLSNAIKYSMPQSRVYINLTEGSGYGSFTIKNMSAFPLDIPPEQLTERFVRGDVSRTTEGSGLGLSIAQSLTALQGGKFKIEIDGDLFKVSVEIPLWVEK